MPEKCNVPAEERGKLLALFPSALSFEEEQEAVKRFDQYLFYHRLSDRKRLYLCTSCGDCWEEARTGAAWVYAHNSPGRCPHCSTSITYKAVGKLSQSYKSLREEHNAVFFHASSDGALLISAGRIVANYEPGAISGWPLADERIFPVPTFDFFERRRYYIKPGRLQCWKRSDGVCKGMWGNLYSYRTNWEAVGTAGEPNPAGYYMAQQPDDGYYMVFGREALVQTNLRYSAVEEFFDFDGARLYRDVVSYLARYSKRPQMEFLVKLGHRSVVVDMLVNDKLWPERYNWRATNPPGFFRLTKAEYKQFAASNASPAVLQAWRGIRDEISLEEYLKIGAAVLTPGDIDTLAELAAKYQLKLVKLLRYLCDGPSRRRPTMWIDYIHMAERLELDLTRPDVLLPKDLAARHDNAVELIEYRGNAERLKQYRKRYYGALCRRYEFEAAGYCIRVPKRAAEIVAEGKALHHCVGGYAPRHMEGKTTILFLRAVESPDTPLCTIEMDAGGKSIRQIRGYHNDLGRESAMITYKAFLDLWLPWLKAGSPRDQQGRPILPGENMDKEAV